MAVLRGNVVSGQGPSAERQYRPVVTLYAATPSGPQFLGRVTADTTGAFAIESPLSTVYSLFYVVAEIRSGTTLLAIVGQTLPSVPVVVNELTTVAAMFCAAQQFREGAIGGGNLALSIVAAMNANLVDVTTGGPSPVISSPPNGDETNALRTLNALANMLAACVRVPDKQPELFALTTPPGTSLAPDDTLTAMHSIARHPAHNVQPLFSFSLAVPVYFDAVVLLPDAWTLAVKVNDSGSDGSAGQMFGGPANIVFDAQGRAWISNNVIQGGPDSTPYSIVLELDGRPSPISPISGGGLLGAGFGVAIDSAQQVWIGSFGWGSEDAYPTGTVTVFNPAGQAVAGYSNAIYRVQATVVDTRGNVWLASYGNQQVVVYPRGDSANPIVYDPGDPLFSPFGIAIAPDGTAWVTNTEPLTSSITHLALSSGRLDRLSTQKIGQAMKGVAVDPKYKTVWAASGGDSFVYAFDEHGTPIGQFNGGGVDGPWGLALDGAGDVWVSNFGLLSKPGENEVTNDFVGRLTKLAGARAGGDMGKPLSPESGFTLRTGGAEVTLHDGSPLYGGTPDRKCFVPLMRSTSANVDAAGNVWVCNNWKPNFDVDHTIGNPGGDGIVIFLGLATPVVP